MVKKIVFVVGLLLASSAYAQVPMVSFADVIEPLMPSVVNISTVNEQGSEEGSSALGSGFIISEDGFIITNNHVIKDAQVISVILSDNSSYEAEAKGFDRKTDLALLKIVPKKPLTPVKFGDSDKMRVGDWVLAIGNPFGLGGSVSAGIVSAKSRDIESGPYDSFIQTDASINQGSSGGPMFNLDGEVVGINTALFTTSGASQGVGFAIPSNIAIWVVEQLKAKGEVRRGWIGIKIQPNTDDIAKSVGLDKASGAVVSGLTVDGSAQKAGIQVGDIVLSYKGYNIESTTMLSRLIAESEIGKTAKIEIWREGKKLTLDVHVDDMPVEAKPVPVVEPVVAAKNDEAFVEDLDLYVREINQDTVAKYHLDATTKGVVVVEVLPTSDAVNKGLTAGDIIMKVDKKDVFTPDDVKRHVEEARMENFRPVLLLVQSRGISHFVALKLK